MPAIEFSNVATALQPAPIEPSWVLSGTPTAHNKLLSTSKDTTACTLVWNCTPGVFEWQYDKDETIHILAGQAILDDGHQGPRTISPGDVVFIPAGSRVHWTVQETIRKLAFFRRTLPGPMAAAVRFLKWARRLKNGGPALDWMGAPTPQGMFAETASPR